MRIHEGSPLGAEDLYRLISDNPRDVVYRTDREGRAIWMTPNITHISGWTQDDLLGTVIDALVHPDDWITSNRIRQSLRAGQPVTEAAQGVGAPLRIRLKDGTYRWMSAIGVPYLDESGEPDGVVGRLRDVHDMILARELVDAEEEQLRSTVEALLDPLIVLSPVRNESGLLADLTIIDANPACCTYAQMEREDLVGRSLLELMPSLAFRHMLDGFEDVLTTGATLVLDDVSYALEIRGGEERYFDVRIARSGSRIVYIFRDQTERRRAQHDLAEREELYRLVTDDVTDAVVRFADDFTVTWASPSIERLTGYSAEQLVGRHSIDLVAPDDQAGSVALRRIVADEPDQTYRRHVRIVHRDGTTRWASAEARPFIRHDGTRDGFVTVVRDIDDVVRAQQVAEHEIGHDRLTGLANRELAIARVTRALEDGGDPTRHVGLLCVGVDRLTTVNQALSYAAGDAVLTTVAARLTAALGDPDRIARAAGDEFVVLLPSVRDASEAAATAQRLVDAAHGTIVVAGRSIEPTVSIGIATGTRSTSAEELLRHASLAARQAKEDGRDRWQFVDPDLAREAQRRLSVESELRNVLRSGRVVPWFMPVVTLADRQTRGYEALARWATDDGNVIPPDEFLPVAEATGLVIDVDLAVMTGALDLLAVAPTIEHVAINVSAPSLASADYHRRFMEVLAESCVDPSRLRLEITETALLSASTDTADVMRQMAAPGSRWYVDDFGTGYSSISHLRDLPVGGLKLDRSFTAGIRTADATCMKLAQGLVGLAAGLGLDTVAEGVETEFEAGALLGQGWHQGQGWLFGKPAPIALG